MGGQIKLPDAPITLLASAERDADAVGDSVRGWRGASALLVDLEIASSDAVADDWLYGVVQGSIDGSTWFDILSLSFRGDTAVPYRRMFVVFSNGKITDGGIVEFDSSTPLDANFRPALVAYYRGLARVTAGSGNHKFTCSLKITPIFAARSRGQE